MITFNKCFHLCAHMLLPPFLEMSKLNILLEHISPQTLKCIANIGYFQRFAAKSQKKWTDQQPSLYPSQLCTEPLPYFIWQDTREEKAGLPAKRLDWN